MMNIIFSALAFLILTTPVQAKPLKKFLVCLGQEESYIHKNKIGGAYAKLNQEMISALVQLSDHIVMRPKLEEKVCNKRFASVEILRLLLTEKKPPFITQAKVGNIKGRAIDKNSIKELQEKSIYIFIDFVNSIQTQMKSANCLTKQIPELQTFFQKLRHTLEDVGMKQIFNKIKNIDGVFNKLQDNNLKQKC